MIDFSLYFLCYLFIVLNRAFFGNRLVTRYNEHKINMLSVTNSRIFLVTVVTGLNNISMEEKEFTTEAQFSCWFHTYVRNTYPATWNLCFHVPNELARVQGESKQAHMIRVQYAKAMGVMPGIEDHFLLWRGCTFMFELKLPTGSVSPKQKEVHKRQNAAGFPVFVVWDKESAQYIVDHILTSTIINFDSITYHIKKAVISAPVS